MSVAALQFVLTAATVQPVSIATAIPSVSIDELSKISAFNTIETAEMPVLIELSFATDTVLSPDTAS